MTDQPTPLRVLVTGSRHYRDRAYLWRSLDRLHAIRPIGVLIEGECHLGGADVLAREWAEDRGVPVEPYPVDVDRDGQWPGAGPARNRRMLRESQPDVVVAFPYRWPLEPRSGTGDMVSHSLLRGVPVHTIKPRPRGLWSDARLPRWLPPGQVMRDAAVHMREHHPEGHARHAFWTALAGWLDGEAEAAENVAEMFGGTAVGDRQQHPLSVARAYLEGSP